MKRYCLAMDLKNEPDKIGAYDDYHTKVWPEIKASLHEAGILDMEIYRVFNHLFMIIEVTPEFSFENKARLDLSNPKVQEWETLMSNFQQQIPGSAPGEKWQVMERVFKYESGGQ